ncbi:HTH_Tnp_Tc3_2 domain-containing protein [Trichonephila clavipes]|nr:HTH_Tnp_Tc3_2 domain-containing protein [Trichonephila clavipes]
MPLRRNRRQYEQLTDFNRGRIIGLREAGWSYRRIGRHLGRSDMVVARCWQQWIAEVPSKTISETTDRSWLEEPTSAKTLTTDPHHRQCRLDFCRPRATWSVTDWRRVIFSDESRFSLSADDHRTRVWRRTGQRSDPAFIVERHTAISQGGLLNAPVDETPHEKDEFKQLREHFVKYFTTNWKKSVVLQWSWLRTRVKGLMHVKYVDAALGVVWKWVPSHVGIPGNERTDQKAKQGAESSQPEVPLTLRRAKSIISTSIDKCTIATQKTKGPESHGKLCPLPANEACPFCGYTRMDGDHLLQCIGLDESPTDDIVSRY